MDDLRVLSACRSYVFRQDHIRLSVVTTPTVLNALQAAFAFQVAAVATPPATYGPVENTAPPGAVFQNGQWQSEDGREHVAIRELYFESRRLVVSAAGPSPLLDGIMVQVRATLEQFTAPDGTPILGPEIEVHAWSELSAVLKIDPQDLIAPAVRAAWRTAAKPQRSAAIVPSVDGQTVALDSEYSGYPGNNPRLHWNLALRQGTLAQERVFYSAAPLDTDGHIQYLRSLEKAIAAGQR